MAEETCEFGVGLRDLHDQRLEKPAFGTGSRNQQRIVGKHGAVNANRAAVTDT